MVRYANLALISNKIIKTVTHEHKCTTQYQYETINTEVQAAATRTSHAPAIDNNIWYLVVVRPLRSLHVTIYGRKCHLKFLEKKNQNSRNLRRIFNTAEEERNERRDDNTPLWHRRFRHQ